MSRRFLLALCAVLMTVGAATDSAQARRLPPPDPTPIIVEPRQAPTLTAHEWGVFVLEGGRPVHLEALAAEVPPFVQRQAGATALPAPAPHPTRPPGTVARKPVLFLYASQPTRVRVQVGFSGGEPWLVYPGAQRIDNIAPGSAGLVWNVQVQPHAVPGLAPVPAGHWWMDLRAVGASTLTAPDGTSERFLFYDGPVAFEPSFLVSHEAGGARVSPASTERVLFLLEGARYAEAEIDPDTRASRAIGGGDMNALRARLLTVLQNRGLSAPEARSLLDTWRDELFRDARRRAVYFVPRAAYDRMLPLQITPAPSQLVRVGLVIDRG